MDSIYRIDTNLIALIVLSITYKIAFKRLNRNDKMNKMFLKMALLAGAQLFSEMVIYVLDGLPGLYIKAILNLFHTFMFIICPYMTYLWCNFVYRWIITNDSITGKGCKRVYIPIIINGAVTIISPFIGLVFYINDTNNYVRGPLNMVPHFATYIYLVMSILIVLKYRKMLMKDEFIPLLMIGVVPAIGAIIQLYIFRVLIMWSSVAFAIVIVFIFIQNKMLQIDSLTNAWTRNSFEHHLGIITKKGSEYNKFGIIFIDLDNFKDINDKFGHQEGDFALQMVVKLIKNIIRKTDIIARFGGDEFVVLLANVTKEDMNVIMDKIDKKFELHNSTSEKPYKLEYSRGYDVFDSDKYCVEQFINYVDHLMYLDKDKKKLFKKVD